MKKVNVLLSTYNGEKYIKELIYSVLSQKKVEVILTIRDDCSTDKTVDIIKSINDPRIVLYDGTRNIGPAKSFLFLLKNCEKADYYAYCDQDDIWYQDKLITADKKICKWGKEPALFVSTYDVVDSNLNILRCRDMHYNFPIRLETTLMYRSPSGCVMVFNEALRKKIITKSPKSIRMHDFWTLLVALGLKAHIETCSKPLMKYRLHDNNTVGLSLGVCDRINRFKKSILNNPNERCNQAKSLYECYKDEFDDDVIEVLEEVVYYRTSYSARVKLAKDIRFREYGFNSYVNLLFITAVLLGLF